MKFKFNSWLKSLCLGVLTLPFVLGLSAILTGCDELTHHSDPVNIDDNYDRAFKGGVIAKDANSYGTEGTDYTANLAYRVRNDETNGYEAVVSYGQASDTNVIIPLSYIDAENITYKVVGIDYSGFANNESLLTVDFQNYDDSNVWLIDAQAFASCPNLTSFNRNSASDTAKAIRIPAQIDTIYSATFMNCQSVNTVVFNGANVKAIQTNAFNNCRSINANLAFKIDETKGLTIGDSAFANCVNLPNIILPLNVTSIGQYAFYNCGKVIYICIPSTVTSVGQYAFMYCPLATAYIGYDVKYPTGWSNNNNTSSDSDKDWNYANKSVFIPIITGFDNVLIDPDNLYLYTPVWDSTNSIWRLTILTYIGPTTTSTRIDIPQTLPVNGDNTHTTLLVGNDTSGTAQTVGVVVKIADEAFSTTKIAGMANVHDISIPNTVEEIGQKAFLGTTGLYTLTFDDAAANNSFYLYPDTGKTTPFALDDFGLTGLTRIKEKAFAGDTTCDSNTVSSSNLTSLHIPATVQYIETWALGGFKYLTDFQINGGEDNTSHLIYIGESGLRALGNSAYTSTTGGNYPLYLPSTCQYIGPDAFRYSFGLTGIYMYNGETAITTAVANTSGSTDGIGIIGSTAFTNCINLSYISISNQFCKIYTQAFNLVSNNGLSNRLEWIYIANGGTTFNSNDAFSFYVGTATNYHHYPIIYVGGTTSDKAYKYFTSTISYSVSMIDFQPKSTSTTEDGGSFVTLKVGAQKLKVYTGITNNLLIDNIPGTLTSNVLYTNTNTGIQYLNDGTNTILSNFLHYSRTASGDLDLSSYSFTQIGDFAFFRESYISNLILPNTITAINKYAFYGCSVATINNSSNMSYLPTSLTTIGEGAFFGANSLTTLALPSTLTSIGSYAFMLMTSITNITVNSSKYISQQSGTYPIIYEKLTTTTTKAIFCPGILSSALTLRSDCVSVASYTFTTTNFTNGTNTNRSVTLPNNVTTLEDCAFYFFYAENKINVKFTVNLYQVLLESRANSKLNSIGANCFTYQTELTTVNLPDNSSTSVLCLKERAFKKCSKLANIALPSNGTRVNSSLTVTNDVYTLATSLFYGCTAIATFSIPTYIGVISDYCFFNCSKMTGTQTSYNINGVSTSVKPLIMPKSVTTVGISAFQGCTALEYIDCSGCTSLTTIGDSAFNGDNKIKKVDFTSCTSLAKFGADVFSGGTAIVELDFTSCTQLTSVPTGLLNGCTNLIKATFDSCTSLTAVSANAFNGCTNLTTLSFNDTGITTLEEAAFKGCSSLKSISFGNSNIVTIGNEVFMNCSSLESMSFAGNTALTTIGTSLFNGCTNLKTVSFNGCSSWKPAGDRADDNMFLGCTALTTVDMSGCTQLNHINNNWFKNCGELTSVNFTGDTGVKYIGGYCFQNCPKLTKVDFSTLTGLSTIWEQVFNGSTSLTKVTTDTNATNAVIIPKTLQNFQNSFQGNTSIISVDLSGVTSGLNFNGSTFNKCTNLTTVVFSNKTNNTGNSTFYNCTSLTSFSNLAGTTIGESSFQGCILLSTFSYDKTKLTTISKNSFTNCKALAFEMGSALQTIGESAFTSCEAIVTFGVNTTNTSLTSIGTYAFTGCTNLKNITLDNFSALTTIGTYAFNNCSKLASSDYAGTSNLMKMPVNLTSIGDHAFRYCTSLERFSLEDVNNFYDGGYHRLQTYMFEGCTKLNSVNLASQVYYIIDYCFTGCTALEFIDFTGVNYIQSYAFKDCTNLASVSFGNTPSVNWIYNNAFNGCTSLKYTSGCPNIGSTSNNVFVIPSSVSQILYEAFKGCTGLQYIFIPTTVEQIQTHVFDGCTRSSLHILIGHDLNTFLSTSVTADDKWIAPWITNSSAQMFGVYFNVASSATSAERTAFQQKNYIGGFFTGSATSTINITTITALPSSTNLIPQTTSPSKEY